MAYKEGGRESNHRRRHRGYHHGHLSWFFRLYFWKVFRTDLILGALPE